MTENQKEMLLQLDIIADVFRRLNYIFSNYIELTSYRIRKGELHLSYETNLRDMTREVEIHADAIKKISSSLSDQMFD